MSRRRLSTGCSSSIEPANHRVASRNKTPRVVPMTVVVADVRRLASIVTSLEAVEWEA